jgi:hypothetical protein
MRELLVAWLIVVVCRRITEEATEAAELARVKAEGGSLRSEHLDSST